jgi:aldehyde dehydrogenase (NAD+)
MTDRGIALAFIEGQAVPAQDNRTFEIRNPATAAVIALSARCGSADVSAAVASASDARRVWRDTKPLDRGRRLVDLARAVREHGTELAELESASAGRLPRDARIDVEVTAQFLEFYGGLAPSVEGSTFGDRPNQLDLTVLEPYGVTGHIIPWNFPMQTAARSIAAALAVGNTVVAKPAEQTPMTCLRLAELAIDCGIPPGVFNVVPGYGPEAGLALACHPDVPRLTFTGSVPTGKVVMRAAAEHLCHVTVELGGKSPLVVFADADFDRAVDGVTKAILTHAGQVCAAGTRLLVQDDVHDEMVEQIRARMDHIVPGSDDDDTAIAPLISERQRQRVLSYLEDGVASGAALLTSVEAAGNSDGYYVRPALLDGVTSGMSVAQEEIFGPVLSVTSFQDVDHAMSLANDSAYGLVAGIWTRDITKALRLAHAIEAGTIYINDYYIGGVELPFGGYKNSGFGREKGRQALESFARVKSIAVSLPG